MGEGERMLELLQRWGSHRAEVRFFLRHNRALGREAGEGTASSLFIAQENEHDRV